MLNLLRKLTAKTNYYKPPKVDGIENIYLIPPYNINTLPDRFIVLDLETTGLDCNNDRIVEIGIAKYKNGKLIGSYEQLINPEIPMPPAATRINKITDDMLKGKPKVYQVIDAIYKMLDGETIAGYNVKFDLGFLRVALGQSKKVLRNIKVLDVLEMSRYNIYGVKNRKLDTMKKHLGINTDKSHRALSDCFATYEVMKECIKARENSIAIQRADQKERISKLNEGEILFIEKLENELDKIGIKEHLNYNIMADKMINFKIKDMQIGRVKLNGRKYKMQILTNKDGEWLEIESVEDAINRIDQWIHYAKYLTR